MDEILEGVVSFLKAGDTSGIFKQIVYSEYIEDLIDANKMPCIDVLGIKERKSLIPGMSRKQAERKSYDISIIIIQDAKLIKRVLHGTGSIWALNDSMWSIIDSDSSFGGLVRDIDDKPIESRMIKLVKNSTYKLGLETELTLVKDVFK